MKSQDYKDDLLFSNGILNGLGISIVVHAAMFFLILSVSSSAMPAGENPVPLCVVTLLTFQELGGGPEGGEEGSMSKGNGEPKPSGGSETTTTIPEPEDEPESERVDLVYVPYGTEAPLPPPPVHRTIKKPNEKPKPASKPIPKPPRVKVVTARAETCPISESKAAIESVDDPDGAVGGRGEGSSRGNTEGTGKGNAGDGHGAGPGTGSGAGQGAMDESFGSGDGPRFVTKAQPNYPRFARERGKEGIVLLRLTIDERGRLIDVELLKRAGAGFDEEAVRSVKESSFSPARRNGKPVTCRAHLPIKFVLRSTKND